MRCRKALGAATGATLREEEAAYPSVVMPHAIGAGAIPVVANVNHIHAVDAVHARSPGGWRSNMMTRVGNNADSVRPSCSHRRCVHPPIP
jgi:hypothetical protein